MQLDNSTRKSSNNLYDNMISEEDKKRYVEATKYTTCLDWHHHCKSECCKVIFIKIDPEELKKPGRFFIIHPQLPFRDLMYYKLHDVEYIRGVLRFRKDRIIVVGRKVLYVYNCKLLDGNLCKGHKTKNFINIEVIVNGWLNGQNTKNQVGLDPIMSLKLLMDMGLLQIKVIEESGIEEHVNLSKYLFGRNLMDLYQRDFKSITSMETNSITASKIYNWLVQVLTKEFMQGLNISMENGGSHVQGAIASKILKISTVLKREGNSANVKSVVLKGRLKINVEEKQVGNKPELCKLLTLEVARLPGQPFELTDNCLFKYKSKEVIEDGKEESNKEGKN